MLVASAPHADREKTGAKSMRNILAATVAIASLGFATAAVGQPGASAEIAAIRAEMAALAARLDRLEQTTVSGGAAPAAAAPAVPAAPQAPRTVDTRVAAADGPNLRFSGDMRYRHEAINEAVESERHRHRIRARFGATADIAENVQVGLTLATGGDDPISANQTLDTGFNRKPIGV